MICIKTDRGALAQTYAMLEQAMPPKNSPADTPSTGKDDASQARGPLAGIGELASFLFAGLGALVRFFGPQPELEMKVDLETKASAAERIEELAAKVAPFPVQDG